MESVGEEMNNNTIPVNRIWHIMLVTLVLLTAVLFASGCDARYTDLWMTYTTEDGLMSNDVRAIAYQVDADGIPGLWIGTDEGLSYTNGTDWVTYSAANSDLPHPFVHVLLSDVEGDKLWVATDQGIAYFQHNATPTDDSDDHWDVFTINDGLPSNSINCLLVDDRGQLWAGTAAGLARYEGDVWKILSDVPTRDLTYDPKRNALWAATDTGLARLDLVSETWTIHYAGHDPETGLPDNNVYALTLHADELWAGTGNGLARYDLDEETWQTWIPGRPGLASHVINDLVVDDRGRVWIATDGGGLSRCEPSGSTCRWRRFFTPGDSSDNSETIASNQVQTLLWTGEVLWAGTANGLSGLDNTWELLSQATTNDGLELASDNVITLLEDSQGRIWVGTRDGGVSVLSPDGTWQTYSAQNGILASDKVSALLEDSQGRVWVGTYGGGVGVLSLGGTWQTYSAQGSGLVSDEITALLKDSQGQVWIGTGDGVSVLAPDGTWYSYSIQSGTLANDWVHALLKDSRDRVWVATDDGVSVREPNGTWQTHSAPRIGEEVTCIMSSPGYNNTVLLEDYEGRLWVGTFDEGGVSVLAPDGSWQTYSTQYEALASDEVYSLL